MIAMVNKKYKKLLSSSKEPHFLCGKAIKNKARKIVFFENIS